jgi:hypothetical protein
MDRGFKVGRALATLGAVALLVGGCGGSSSSTSTNASGAIQRAAFVSNASSGYRMAMTMQISAPSQSIQMTGDASINLHPTVGAMTWQMALPVAALGHISVREILAHNIIYMQLPASLRSRMPGGKPWLALNLSQALKSAGVSGLSSLMNSSSSDPSAYLKYLKLASSSQVHDLGPAKVDGVQAEQYRTTLDLQKTPAALPAADRAGAQQLIAQLGQLTGLRYVPMTVWIDSQHLVRQLAMSMTERPPNGGQPVRVSLQARFLSYGRQPVPATPPASQVTDITSLLHTAP